MANFNQQGQTVQYQYNAETINFGAVNTAEDFSQQLKNLQAELNKAIDSGAISEDSAVDAEASIKKAVLQANKPTPDKKTLVEHLSSAKELVTGVSGLAKAITSAIATVGSLF